MRSKYRQGKETGQRTKDSAVQLAHGSRVVATNLARDLDAAETDLLIVSDAGNSSPRGVVVVEDEIIFYHRYDRGEPGTLSDLLRGQQGSQRVAHRADAEVVILSSPRFGNPAVAEAIIAMQEDLLDLLVRVEGLEK